MKAFCPFFCLKIRFKRKENAGVKVSWKHIGQLAIGEGVVFFFETLKHECVTVQCTALNFPLCYLASNLLCLRVDEYVWLEGR